VLALPVSEFNALRLEFAKRREVRREYVDAAGMRPVGYMLK